jgi:hypothetical protein
MKLPMGNTRQHTAQQIYRGRVVSRQPGGIRSAADNDFGTLELYGCVRPLIGFVKSRIAEHCFLRVEGSDGEIMDSASFGQNGGDERDRREGGNFKCTHIGTISFATWSQIKGYFSRCGDYSVRRNNCCTCAVGALGDAGLDVPKSFTQLNHGVGTTNTCALQ